MSRSPQQPVIIINGVTYRSPEEIPEHLRALWEENIRTLEQHGVDWRGQQRIDLTWSHEATVVRRRLNVEGRPRHSPSQPSPLLEAVVTGYVIGWGALSFYGLMWHDPPLIFDFSDGWLYVVLILLCAPWVLIVINAYRNRQRQLQRLPAEHEDIWAFIGAQNNVSLHPDRLGWKLVGSLLVGVAAIAMMTYFAVFGGATKLLHYAERKPGDITAVVTGKQAYSSKQCSPWIALDGFRSTGKRLCVSGQFFNNVNVGDRVRITGMLSRYAMEPEQLDVVVDN